LDGSQIAGIVIGCVLIVLCFIGVFCFVWRRNKYRFSGGFAPQNNPNATLSNINQPGYGQPKYGQPMYGQPIYGQPMYGQPMYG
jgi:hypothetical protein